MKLIVIGPQDQCLQLQSKVKKSGKVKIINPYNYQWILPEEIQNDTIKLILMLDCDAVLFVKPFYDNPFSRAVRALALFMRAQIFYVDNLPQWLQEELS